MKNRRTFFGALVIMLALMVGANVTANAQIGLLGSLAGAAIDKASEKKADIPKAKKKGKPITFNWSGTTIGTWNPATLEITFNKKDDNGQLPVYTINASNGSVTGKDGKSKGSMSDGSLVSPNLGTLTVKKKEYPIFEVFCDGDCIGTVTPQKAVAYVGNSKKVLGEFADEVSPLLVAYVYFGVLLSADQVKGFASGYGFDMTSDQLDNMIEWNDQESMESIIKYEKSLPCAGFKETNPELKNCKVAAVGLEGREWVEYKYVQNGITQYEYKLNYWVVYELTDGRNVVVFSTASRRSKYSDVTSKWKRDGETFHLVTDWQRQ